jgi:hypothetical protein
MFQFSLGQAIFSQSVQITPGAQAFNIDAKRHVSAKHQHSHGSGMRHIEDEALIFQGLRKPWLPVRIDR